MNSGVLSDRDIIREVHEHRRKNKEDSIDYDGDGLNIEPYTKSNVQPASYDLTLGGSFKVEPEDGDTTQGVRYGSVKRKTYDHDRIIVQPGEFMLGHAQETVSLPSYISGEVKGRSSIGRMGLIPHTAGWVDAGFSGQITLEFVNHSSYPVEIRSGDRIAQIVFTYMNEPAAEPYGEKDDSKYQGQTGVTESRIEKDET